MTFKAYCCGHSLLNVMTHPTSLRLSRHPSGEESGVTQGQAAPGDSTCPWNRAVRSFQTPPGSFSFIFSSRPPPPPPTGPSPSLPSLSPADKESRPHSQQAPLLCPQSGQTLGAMSRQAAPTPTNICHTDERRQLDPRQTTDGSHICTWANQISLWTDRHRSPVPVPWPGSISINVCLMLDV